MAKHPAPGRVKTRLSTAIGPAAAAELSRTFILDLADRLRSLPIEVSWAYWPPAAPFRQLVRTAACRPQRGRDLGARMRNAMARAFAGGADRVLVVGADVPHVAAAEITRACAALGDGADVVLGPAHDGGYYLLGARGPVPALLRAMPWGSAEVFALTIARARALGLRIALLEPTFDVDQPADLLALAAMIARGEAHLPRTARLLARLGLRPEA